MLRPMTEFPDNYQFIRQLEPHYEGKKCKGNRCPHRGANLTGIQPNANGQVVCPMHGLSFNSEGVCEPRKKKQRFKKGGIVNPSEEILIKLPN